MPAAADVQPAVGERPYWARLWPTAEVVAAYIDRNPQLVTAKHCLELGAGVGLPSFTAARYAASVLATDLDPGSVAALQHTQKMGGYANVRVGQLNWNEPLPDAELLLLSDVNYDPALFEGLARTLHQQLALGKTIVLGSPQRLVAKSFLLPFLPFCQLQEEGFAGDQAVTVFVLADL